MSESSTKICLKLRGPCHTAHETYTTTALPEYSLVSSEDPFGWTKTFQSKLAFKIHVFCFFNMVTLITFFFYTRLIL